MSVGEEHGLAACYLLKAMLVDNSGVGPKTVGRAPSPDICVENVGAVASDELMGALSLLPCLSQFLRKTLSSLQAMMHSWRFIYLLKLHCSYLHKFSFQVTIRNLCW